MGRVINQPSLRDGVMSDRCSYHYHHHHRCGPALQSNEPPSSPVTTTPTSSSVFSGNECLNSERYRERMFATAIRLIGRKPKPKMKPIELKTPPEQTQTITRVIFDIVKEHGPLTISDTWEHIKEVGVRGLTSKRHMKIVLRWMRERQKLRLICNHVGPHKQFLYTTWFTNPKIMPSKPKTDSSDP